MPKLQKLPRETIFEKTGFMEITQIRSTEHGVKLCPQAKFSEKQVHGQTFYIVIININGFLAWIKTEMAELLENY